MLLFRAAAPATTSFFCFEDREIHGLSHGFIAGVVRVQVIAGIELRFESLRILRIAGRRLEIHDRVERPGLSNPIVIVYGPRVAEPRRSRVPQFP